MTWRGEARATLALAWPLIGAQLAQHGIHAVDVIMAGRLGPEALAAALVGASVFHLFFIFGVGVLMAVATLAAQAKGARDMAGIRRSVRQGLWSAALIAGPAMAALAMAAPALRAFGQPADLVVLAQTYLDAMLWSLPGALGFVVLRCFVSALGRPGLALAAMIAAFVVNIPADYVLMFGLGAWPGWGLVGAGVASAGISTGLFLGLLAYVLIHRRLRRHAILARFWRPDWGRFRRLWVIGLPIAGTMLAEVGLFVVAAQLMAGFGVIAAAAHAVALHSAALAFMLPLGLGQAATVRVGWAHGAGDGAGVRRAGWTAIGLGLGITLVAAVVFLAAPEAMIWLFLGGAPDPAVAGLAATLLAVAGAFQLVDGAQTVAAQALRGLGDTRVPMVLALVAYWPCGFGLALALAYGAGFGPLGIWLGLAAGLAMAALLLVGRFRWITRRPWANPGQSESGWGPK